MSSDLPPGFIYIKIARGRVTLMTLRGPLAGSNVAAEALRV
jgi:hypothetical protein